MNAGEGSLLSHPQAYSRVLCFSRHIMDACLSCNLSAFLQVPGMVAMGMAAIRPQQATVSVHSLCLHLGSYGSIVWV